MKTSIQYLLAATLLSAVPALAATTVWTANDSPVRITETYTVLPEDTLTVEAGVDVIFDADVPLVVEGSIHVRGTESDSVRFLPGTADGWGGLRISGGDSSSFAYARVSGVWSLPFDTLGTTVDSARVLFAHSVFAGDSTYKGGALRVRRGAVYLRSTRLVDNFAFEGGGLHAEDSSFVAMDSCEVSYNGVYDYGGGLYLTGGSFATIANGHFIGNDGVWTGGAIHVSGSSAELVRCVLANNEATPCGGGADICIGNPGGAVYVSTASGASPSATATLENCTIYGNDNTIGGSITSIDQGAHILIENSILWGNTSPPAPRSGGTIEIRYSNLDFDLDGYPNSNNMSVDPLLANPQAGDFRLRPGSPAIDAGDPALTDPDGSRLDMGAVPYDETIVSVAPQPEPFRLILSAAPNPFNPATTIRFTLPEPGAVRLAVYDINGRLVRTLVNGVRATGSHAVVWDGLDATGREVASGVYVVRLYTPTARSATRVTLVR